MNPILAYLDPVTGGAIMQVALAALAVAGLGFQYIKKGVRTLIARFQPGTNSSDSPATAVESARHAKADSPVDSSL